MCKKKKKEKSRPLTSISRASLSRCSQNWWGPTGTSWQRSIRSRRATLPGGAAPAPENTHKKLFLIGRQRRTWTSAWKNWRQREMRLSLVLLINRSGAARRGNYNEGKKRPFNDVLKSNRGFEVKIHSQSSVSTINKHHLLFVANCFRCFPKDFAMNLFV